MGRRVGCCVGRTVGCELGCPEGKGCVDLKVDGQPVGWLDGLLVGCDDG